MVTEYIVDEEAEQLKVAGVCRRADGVWATPVVVHATARKYRAGA